MEKKMNIAVPTQFNRLCTDIMKCKDFTIFTVSDLSIEEEKLLSAPSQQIEKYSRWFKTLQVDLIITAEDNPDFNNQMRKNQIRVITGAPPATPRMLVEIYALQKDNYV
jgi:predicted Fe-Mo cluster-binding NifX family protein